MFWASQLAGGITAGVTATMVFGPFKGNFGPAGDFTWVEAGAVEVLYTFMLCFVVLRVAVAEVNSDYSEYFPIAIGFVVVAGGYAGGGISGGAFNPAVAFGLDVASAHLGFKYCLVYTLFEFVGAALAVAVHMTVDSRKDTEPTLAKKAISEFVGTYFLVLTVYLNVTGASPAGGLSIAASLMCMIYALGGVSGANFNPAVTLALLITGKGGMSGSLAPVYMGGRFRGGDDVHCHHRNEAYAPPGRFRIHAGVDRGDLLHVRPLLRRSQRCLHDHAGEAHGWRPLGTDLRLGDWILHHGWRWGNRERIRCGVEPGCGTP